MAGDTLDQQWERWLVLSTILTEIRQLQWSDGKRVKATSVCQFIASKACSRKRMEDPSFFEHLLNDEELVPLMDAVRPMQGLSFWHGSRRRQLTFDCDTAEPSLRTCLAWAESESCPQDARQELTLDQRAAIRAWTCTSLCYGLTSALRNTQRTLEGLKPVLPYARLLFSALHALPKTYIFERGTLYRAERGVMDTWDAKMRAPEGIFSFYVPTSCSTNPKVLQQFKDEGERTVYKLHDASGWILNDFSPYQEEEVLLEPVCHFQVLRAEKFDEGHEMVLSGDVENKGLHKVEGRVRPGVHLLQIGDTCSRVKNLETESYWARLASERDQAKKTLGQLLELEFDPFSEEEWKGKGKVVPKKDMYRDRKMSFLGKGAFMTTHRKRAKRSATLSTPSQVCRYAVKIASRNDLHDQGISDEDVQREARILQMMRHKNVIQYHGLEEDEEEIGLILEFAEGGSVADLIRTRGQASGLNSPGVHTSEAIEMMIQIARAMEYIHGQGIVHRDIKADNILISQAYGSGPLCIKPNTIKVADFGVAAVLATSAGPKLKSRVGTDAYFAPERGEGKNYGTKADMWAVGCVLIELVTMTRLTMPIWNSGTEVSERRKQLLEQVRQRDQALETVAQGLLSRDQNVRLDGFRLKAALDTWKTVEFERSIPSLQSQKDVDAIVRGMKLHDTHPGIQEKACGALLALTPCAKEEEWRRIRDEKGDEYDSVMASLAEFAQLGVIEHLVQVLSSHLTLVEAVAPSCQIICCLARNDDNSIAIAEAGGIERLMAALSTHAGHAGVVEQACGAVRNLAVNDDNKIAIAEAGGIERLMAALSTHADHAGVVEQACGAVGNLARGNDDNKIAIAEAGGIERLMAALSTHAGHAGVVEQACGAVGNLARGNDDNKIAIAEAGGIERLMAALSTHAGHAGVVKAACWAVGNLASGNDDNKIAIVEAGGIERLMAALSTHAGHAGGVVEQACGAVGNLAGGNDDNKIAIAEAGGIERLMAALSTHAGHAGVVHAACGALYNIGRSDRSLQHSIKDAGAEELLRAAVARSNATAQTKEKGRKLLNKLIKL